MYTVSKTLTSAYGAELEPKPMPTNRPIMPQVTGENKRVTNVKLSSGECVQGIRRNNDDAAMAGGRGRSFNKENELEQGKPFSPLRYTPGLKCDAHLESLRPERSNKHSAFTGPEQYGWRKKLVQTPESYEGSFADADLEQFRPEPKKPPVTADPWFTSRVPEPEYFPLNERLAAPPAGVYTGNPYEQVYPQDELSRIKMRNRRFQTSMGNAPMAPPEQMMGGYPAVPQHPMMISPQAYYASGFFPPMGYPMGYPPMGMMGQPNPMMQQGAGPMGMQQPSEGSPLDDLKVLDQELNVTRRVTRPYVPTDTDDYKMLQKERDMLDMPMMPIPVQKPKSAVELCPTSVDQLPKPKERKAPKKRDGDDAARRPPKPDNVRIADQIAIRSMVLGKNLPSVGGSGAVSPGGGAGSSALSGGSGRGSRQGARSSSLPSTPPGPASPPQQMASPVPPPVASPVNRG